MTSVRPPTARPGFPAEAGTAELLGYGRISWGQLTTMLAGAPCAWADYSGFHLGAPPAESPPYTHLWAWTSHWLARARIDNGTAIAGVLALWGEPSHAPPVLSRESVEFHRTQANTWPQKEKRVGRLPDHVAGQPMDVYLIPEERPITFVAAQADTGSTRAGPERDAGSQSSW